MTRPAERLGPALLDRLPPEVARPAYDRAAVTAGIAHLGVGAFHRCHQAEFADDLLGLRPGPWGIVGINLRPPDLGPTLGAQSGLYTRLCRSGDAVEPRVVGSILRVVDAQQDPAPALDVLADPAIHVVTLTVTEKAYCHEPATGRLDEGLPEVAADLAGLDRPRSLPGVIARALEIRRERHGRPLTLVSCDNVPGNGAILERAVMAIADRRPGLARWIGANAAFPSTMVDRIAPATTAADIAEVEASFGYRDEAVAVGEPFRQWVIEDRFAGPVPPWDRAGAVFAADVTPFEHLKMRVLNGAQTALACLGALAGHVHTSDAIADPVLARFVERMLLRETLPTLAPVPGIEPAAYVAESLARLRNTAIRHRTHQIATDTSRKIVQRLLNPALERLRRGEDATHLALATAAWIAYALRGSETFGHAWQVDDPEAARIAGIAARLGRDPEALAGAILSLDGVFPPDLAARPAFRGAVAAALPELLSPDPLAPVRRLLDPERGAPQPTGTLAR